MMINRALARCLFCLLLFGGATAAAANSKDIRWYDVEVLIFENIDVPHSTTTQWRQQVYVPLLESAVSPGKANSPIADMQRLSTQTRRLSGEAYTLEKSSRYRLLVHETWRQIGRERARAVPVRIRRGAPIPVFVATGDEDITSLLSLSDRRGETNTEAPMSTPTTAARPVKNFRAAYTQPQHGQTWNKTFAQTSAYPLDGTITVALGRYLHVYTDLALTKVLPTAGLQSFIMQSHRRMRSRELHYIDHPKLGVLVLITPYKPEREP